MLLISGVRQVSWINNNLLPVTLTKDEIIDKMDNSLSFKYSALEGGYISSDYTVILVTDRFPYVGQLLKLNPDVGQFIQNLWISRLCEIFEIKLWWVANSYSILMLERMVNNHE